jgi:hypothetical protein
MAGGAAARPSAFPNAAPGDPVVAAAGDIVCNPADGNFNGGNGTASACRQKYTASLLQRADVLLPLGDLQYEDGTLGKFTRSYARRWGAYDAVTHLSAQRITRGVLVRWRRRAETRRLGFNVFRERGAAAFG